MLINARTLYICVFHKRRYITTTHPLTDILRQQESVWFGSRVRGWWLWSGQYIAWPDDTDLHTPLTISQEDIPSETLSPRRSLTESTNGFSHKSLSPERLLTDSLVGQAALIASGLVSASSVSSSLTTQSSTSSTVAMVAANGVEEWGHVMDNCRELNSCLILTGLLA